MKTKIKFLIVATILSATWISCQKTESQSLILENDIELRNETSIDAAFYETDPIELGFFHNEILGMLHSEISTNDFVDVKTALKNIEIEGLTDEMKNASYNIANTNTSEENDKVIRETLKSEKGYIIYSQLDEYLNNVTDYDQTKQGVLEILEIMDIEVKNNFDKQLISIYAHTCIASADYWLNDYNDDLPGETAEWVKADGRGAGIGSISWAAGAFYAAVVLGGPVGAGGYFLCVGVSAALSSIMYNGGTTTTTGN